VDPPDVPQGVLDDVLEGGGLVGVPGVGVAVGDHQVAPIQCRPHRPVEVGGVVGGVEKQLRERIGVVVADRPPDGVAVPRVRRLAREDGVGERLPETLPDRRLPRAVDPLERDEHAGEETPHG